MTAADSPPPSSLERFEAAVARYIENSDRGTTELRRVLRHDFNTI